MHTFVQPGERVFVIVTSGSLSLSQSILTLFRRDFDAGKGLATAQSLYDAARIIGETDPPGVGHGPRRPGTR